MKGEKVEVIGAVSYGIAGVYEDDGCNAGHPEDLTLPAF